MSKRHFIQLTDVQKRLHASIENLRLYMENATLPSAEMAQHIDMTRKQKEKLVTAIYFKDKKERIFILVQTDGLSLTIHNLLLQAENS